MIKTALTITLPFLAALALSAPAAARAATPDPSACIWGQLPEAGRTQAMAATSLDGVNKSLEDMLNGWNEEAFNKTMALCKVGDQQVSSAASLLAAFSIRQWAELQLRDVWSPAELDKAYRGLTPAERALLKAGTGDDGTEPEGHSDAVEHFYGPLAIDKVPHPAIKLAFIYLIARLTQDASLIEYNSK